MLRLQTLRFCTLGCKSRGHKVTSQVLQIVDLHAQLRCAVGCKSTICEQKRSFCYPSICTQAVQAERQAVQPPAYKLPAYKSFAFVSRWLQKRSFCTQIVDLQPFDLQANFSKAKVSEALQIEYLQQKLRFCKQGVCKGCARHRVWGSVPMRRFCANRNRVPVCKPTVCIPFRTKASLL